MKIFAWRGINLEIPDKWELLSVAGNDNKGYVSLGGLSNISLEIKWTHYRFKVIIDKVLNKFLKSIEKKASQKQSIFSSLKNINLINKKDVLSYQWTAGSITAYGVMWHCNTCKRVVLAQTLNENNNKAKEILSTLKCHDDTLWSVYNLYFIMPEGWNLESYIFKSGFIQFVFMQGNKKITIERWGLGKNLIGSKTLKEWFMGTYKEKLKKSIYNEEKVLLKNHEGLRVKIFPKRIFKLFALKDETIMYDVWFCKNSNRIFLVKESSCNLNEIQKITGVIKCH